MSAERDWWRGNDYQTRQRLQQAMEDGGDTKTMLYDQVYVGQSALRLIAGIATLKDVSAVMSHLIVSCENEVRDCTKRLLGLHDTGSQEARDLHFQARVAAAILSHINQLVEEGENAAQTLNNGNPHE